MNRFFVVSPQLTKRLAEHHLSVPDVLRLSGLPTGFFQQEKSIADTAQFFALYKAIGELSSEPDIGLKMGADPRLERYHPVGVVAVCSQNFRDALVRLSRYKQLTCPEQILVTIQGNEAIVEFAYLEAEEVEPDTLVDVGLAWLLSVGQTGTDRRIKPQRLELTRSERHREVLESHFGCQVKFKAARNALIFAAVDLDQPFVTHNQELLDALGVGLDNELAESQTNGKIVDLVKRTLKRSLAGGSNYLASVSHQLAMSSRTLQRKLAEAETTFQQLLEETRREMAHHYLQHGTVEINEIAFLLGYENANSFYRAFHRWEGVTPGEWRRSTTVDF
jgi:AraC-like DNA-binding protein